MTGLSEEMARLAEARAMFPRGSRILVAASGGMDSTVLLHLLHGLAPDRKWQLVVAHLNHQLRGRSSELDARFVKAQCKRLGLPCITGRREVRLFAKRRKISIEMAARDLRHRFLARTARRQKCSVIALAHHADDQAELILLRLLRGSGSGGLGAMRPVSPSPIDSGIHLVRPLLEVSREWIAAFAVEAGIRFREDRSNADRRLLRNRIRHELLPLLRKSYQQAVDRVLVRTAAILSAESDCLNELASQWILAGTEPFDDLPLALKRRVVQLQSVGLGMPLDFETCELLLQTADQAVSAPGGRVLVRGSDGMLARVQPRVLTHSNEAIRVPLSDEGETSFAGRRFRWRVASSGKSRRPRPRTGLECFDAAGVGRNILLRHWRAGDRFQPIGMVSPVKLQDLFTNSKVPHAERRKRVVAETESGEIFWVEGLRIGDRFKLEPNTRKLLIWRWNC